MMKREANGSFGVAEGSRPKRARREVNLYEGSSEGEVGDVGVSDDHLSDDEEPSNAVFTGRMNPQEVKRHGLQILQSVKAAVNKEGQLIYHIFWKKPSKKTYPDYYHFIHHPIALDDIEKKLEKGGYPTLGHVRQDFELCFNNAQVYNQEGSEIWNDARDLLKLVNKAYNKIVPSTDGETKKPKPPSLNKLLKTRLQSLIDMTDSYGRFISAEFMQLPSKKLWPIYYKQIKKPQCFDNISEKLKRKEYLGAGDFAADVELIFSNAMEFNQEHTQIWEDALTLRNTFKKLMSDLPPQYSLPQYSMPTKIKIKPPGAKPAESSQPSLTLRVPATSAAQQKPASVAPPRLVVPTPAPALPPSAPASLPAPARPAPQTLPIATPKPVVPPQAPPVVKPVPKPSPRPQPQPQAAPTPQPVAAPSPLAQAPTSHYAPVSYVNPNVRAAPSPAPTTPAFPSNPSHILRTSSAQNVSTPAVVPTPPPAPPAPQYQLKSVRVQVQPRGRVIYLHHLDGVKSWALRLLPGETRLVVDGVTFLASHDDDESSSEEEEDDEEDEYEDGMAVDTSPRSTKKKAKTRKRGRPTRASTRQATNAQSAKKKSKPGEVQLKVNGLVLKDQSEQPGEWDVHLQVGPSTLEIGEVGGMIWKVYVERVAAA